MLKIEYPGREVFSSYEKQIKPTITWAQAKKHLHDIRFRRQNQLESNINECHKLHQLHKQMFDRYCESKPIEKLPDKKPTKPINKTYVFHTNKYSTPRIEYAPVIYRKAVPTFEVESSLKSDYDIPIIRELTQYLSESTFVVSNEKTENYQLLSSIPQDQHRRLSVSSVASHERRSNKVYEKWPDYNEISEIVGYRIDPPPLKVTTLNTSISRPSGTRGQRKRSSAIGFPMASKQIKNMVSLNSSPTRVKVSKVKQTTKTEPAPITIDKLPESNDLIRVNNPIIQENKPKLPTFLCPSSAAYSSRTLTRQWLMKNNFSSNVSRTIPLV